MLLALGIGALVIVGGMGLVYGLAWTWRSQHRSLVRTPIDDDRREQLRSLAATDYREAARRRQRDREP